MGGDVMVTAFVVLDKTMATLGHRDHALARASDAEVDPVPVAGMRTRQPCVWSHRPSRKLAVANEHRITGVPLPAVANQWLGGVWRAVDRR